MSPINLLPKESVINVKKKHKGKASFIVAIFIMLCSAVAVIGLCSWNYFAFQEIDLLVPEIEITDKEIANAIENNKFLSIESRVDDIKVMLSEHFYFSKAIKLIQNNLIDEVFLTHFSLSYDKSGELILLMDGIGADYYSVANQIAVLRGLSDVTLLDVKNVSVDKTGFISFSVELKLNKSVVLFWKDQN